jgi:hypothetical protein
MSENKNLSENYDENLTKQFDKKAIITVKSEIPKRRWVKGIIQW